MKGTYRFLTIQNNITYSYQYGFLTEIVSLNKEIISKKL